MLSSLAVLALFAGK
ncbi:MAG: hypothetical protein DMF63_17755 [Acidobacteria bacterium]|nr:MAG: hypothetical protein DMF63_17755 [Acidobacteriota bacterium]